MFDLTNRFPGRLFGTRNACSLVTASGSRSSAADGARCQQSLRAEARRRTARVDSGHLVCSPGDKLPEVRILLSLALTLDALDPLVLFCLRRTAGVVWRISSSNQAAPAECFLHPPIPKTS